MRTAGRNRIGLTDRQIECCLEAWLLLRAENPITLDTSEAARNASRTRFDEQRNKFGFQSIFDLLRIYSGHRSAKVLESLFPPDVDGREEFVR